MLKIRFSHDNMIVNKLIDRFGTRVNGIKIKMIICHNALSFRN